MRNILIIWGLIVVLAIAYILFKSGQNPTDRYEVTNQSSDVGFANSATFTTDDQEFTITYSDNADIAVLNYNGENYKLERALSASGARYVTVDDSVVFWEHQGEALIEIDGEIVVEGAKITPVLK